MKRLAWLTDIHLNLDRLLWQLWVGLGPSRVRSKIENVSMLEGESHVQEEDFAKRPVSMRQRKEVQELLLWEEIRVGRER
jgi:hypothetical protein